MRTVGMFKFYRMTITWLMVSVTDDEDTRGCLDDIVGDGLELIDPHDSTDLGEEAFEQTKVASRDSFDSDDGLGVGEIVHVEC